MKTLIVVDPQQAYFLPDCLPVVNGEQSLANIRAIVQAFPGPKILVKHVATGTPFATDHPGHQLADGLDSLDFIAVVIKQYASAFTETGLGRWLDRHSMEVDDGPDEIYVCGYQSHHCVLATALEAAAYAPKVFVVTDACSSPNLWEASGVTAHNVAMASADQFFCTVIETADAIAAWTAPVVCPMPAR